MKKYLFILSVTLCGCSKPVNNGENFDFASFANQQKLTGVELQLGEELQLPKRICVAGNKLLIINFMTPKFISVYDLTGTYLGDFLNTGRADNEVLAIDNTHADLAAGLFTVNDFMSQKLLTYAIANLENPQNIRPERIIKTVDMYDNPYLLKDGRIIYIPATLNTEDRIKIADMLGTKQASFAPYPMINNERIEIGGYEIFMPHFVINEKKSRVAIFSKNCDVIDIYAIDGRLLSSKSGPEHFYPEYLIESGGDLTSIQPVANKARRAYFNAVSRGDKIWVMYSGGLRAEVQSCKYIMTFDWDGNPTDCYSVDDGLVDFDVDTKQRVIFALHITKEGKNKIITYNY